MREHVASTTDFAIFANRASSVGTRRSQGPLPELLRIQDSAGEQIRCLAHSPRRHWCARDEPSLTSWLPRASASFTASQAPSKILSRRRSADHLHSINPHGADAMSSRSRTSTGPTPWNSGMEIPRSVSTTPSKRAGARRQARCAARPHQPRHRAARASWPRRARRRRPTSQSTASCSSGKHRTAVRLSTVRGGLRAPPLVALTIAVSGAGDREVVCDHQRRILGQPYFDSSPDGSSGRSSSERLPRTPPGRWR
jgi:hypothetical protein